MAWRYCLVEQIGKLRHKSSKGLSGSSDVQGAPVVPKPSLSDPPPVNNISETWGCPLGQQTWGRVGGGEAESKEPRGVPSSG